jgi:hypothetical protein
VSDALLKRLNKLLGEDEAFLLAPPGRDGLIAFDDGVLVIRARALLTRREFDDIFDAARWIEV